MSGKGSKRRNENTEAVEANWPTNWNARDSMQHMPSDTGSTEGGSTEGEGEQPQA